MTRQTTEERFKSLYTVSKRNCWMWSGDVDSRGFPRFYLGVNDAGMPRYSLAARHAWKIATGVELERGETLRKKCVYKKCVNPAHHMVYKDGPNAKLSREQREELVKLFTVKKLQATLLAKEFGISRQQVYNIISNSCGDIDEHKKSGAKLLRTNSNKS